MKSLFIIPIIFSFNVHSQNLSPEEQRRLIEENKALKAEVQRLQNPATVDSVKIMEALQKGKKFQEEQNKALEELEKEE